MPSFYEITCPLPTSVNAAHGIGKGQKGQYIIRSSEYTAWIKAAGRAWRDQYPLGIESEFEGRVRIDYIFLFIAGARGTASSDIDNRIKCLQDFLQGKFFKNDNQIDEIHAYRRLTNHGENRVIVRIWDIPENRHGDYRDIFTTPKKES